MQDSCKERFQNINTGYLDPKVCKLTAFSRFWAVILHSFGVQVCWNHGHDLLHVRISDVSAIKRWALEKMIRPCVGSVPLAVATTIKDGRRYTRALIFRYEGTGAARGIDPNHILPARLVI